MLFLMLTGLGYAQNGKVSEKDSVNSTSRIIFRKVPDRSTIYLLGGIVSAISQREIDFAKKYHVIFHDFGCVAPTNLSDYEAQNKKVFELLNVQFGPKWQEELNPNSLGFKKWLEK